MAVLVSVVVGDDDVARFASVKIENDAELIVDADAVPAVQRSFELLQIIAGLERSRRSVS
jgi:hypothetical protein